MASPFTHPPTRTSKDSSYYTRQRRIGQEAYPRALRGSGSEGEFGGWLTEGKFGGAENMAMLSALGLLLHLLIVGKTVAIAQKVRRRLMSEKFYSDRLCSIAPGRAVSGNSSSQIREARP